MKNLVRFVIFFTLFFLNNSCEKDDSLTLDQSENNPISARILTGSKVPNHILDYVSVKTDNSFKVYISKREISLANGDSDSYSRETPLGIVQTNKVVQVYNERNTKYTFQVTDPSNANAIINLIVVDMDGDIIEYFIQYIFDPNVSIPLLESGAVDMSRFTGITMFYDNTGVIIGTYSFSEGQVIETDGLTDPCPEDETIENTENTDPNTGGGTSGNVDTGDPDPSGSGDDGTSGAGEFENTDEEPCGIVITYEPCECGGDANGHGASSCCADGSPTTITDTCTGASVTYYADRSSSAYRAGGSSPCDGDTGVLIEIEEESVNTEDESFQNSQTNCIHNLLINDDDENFYKIMLSTFEESDYDMLFFKIGETEEDWGITQGTEINETGGGFDVYYITTSNDIENASNLSKMVTLSHEMIHAFMFNSLDELGIISFDDNGLPFYNPNICNGFEPIDNLNSLNIRERWVALICAYNEHNTNSENWSHHLFNSATFVVNTYREQLESFIFEQNDWDNESALLKNLLQSQFGPLWKEKAAEYISWRGLENTEEFEDWAQENNLESSETTVGFSSYFDYNMIVTAMKDLGNGDCD